MFAWASVHRGGDRGSVVLIALLLAGVVVTLGVSLVTMAGTERTVAANHQTGLQTYYGAEALAEHVIVELQSRPQWTGAISGVEPSAFASGSITPMTTWHEVLDLPRLTAELQNDTYPAGSWGADTPRWQLVAWGPFGALTGRPESAPLYLAAWIADDPADGDGNPAVESNGSVLVRTLAVGHGGLRRSVQAVLKREDVDTSVTAGAGAGVPAFEASAASAVARNLPSPGGVFRLLSWREVR
jgi:hypothetical protein